MNSLRHHHISMRWDDICRHSWLSVVNLRCLHIMRRGHCGRSSAVWKHWMCQQRNYGKKSGLVSNKILNRAIEDGDWGGIKDEGQGREMFSQQAEDSSQVWQVVKNSWHMYVCYPSTPTHNHLRVITKETKRKQQHFMTISFIQIIKLGRQFTFAVYVVCRCLALLNCFWRFYILNVWDEGKKVKKGRKTFLCGLCNDSKVALCQFTVLRCQSLKRLMLPIWKILLTAAKQRQQMKLTRQCQPAWLWIWSWLCWCRWWKQLQPNHNLSCWLFLSLPRWFWTSWSSELVQKSADKHK